MVIPALACDEGRGHYLRNGDFARRARLQAAPGGIGRLWTRAGADRWRYADLGVASDPGIRGGKISRRRIMAAGCWRASSCSRCLLRDACGIHGVAAPIADECGAAG